MAQSQDRGRYDYYATLSDLRNAFSPFYEKYKTESNISPPELSTPGHYVKVIRTPQNQTQESTQIS